MSSRFLIAIAIIFLIGAVFSAIWGLQQTSQSIDQNSTLLEDPNIEISPQEIDRDSVEEAVETSIPVVMLAKDVSADIPLSLNDLYVQSMKIAPPGSFSDVQAVIGKSLWRDFSIGSVLNESSFGNGGPLPRMIRADERALAISVDEILSGGGHLRPGDYVDVLLYLRQDANNADHTMQVVIPAIRVLSVGETLGEPLDGTQSLSSVSSLANTAQRRAIPRSVVLAIPASLVTRFSLAVHVGSLSLAVRSADDLQLANYYHGEVENFESISQQLVRFEEFALKGESSIDTQESSLAPEKAVDVFRGTTLSREIP